MDKKAQPEQKGLFVTSEGLLGSRSIPQTRNLNPPTLARASLNLAAAKFDFHYCVAGWGVAQEMEGN